MESATGDVDQQFKNNQYPAGVFDRTLAFAIDFSLLSPVFLILMSPLYQQLQLKFYFSMESSEFLIFLGLFLAGYSVLTWASFGFFWWKWGATPGQKILKLKVVQDDGRLATPLSIVQAFTRSLFFVLSVFGLGLPFLGVISHPRRRHIADRIADTLLVTSKPLSAPHALEIRFVRNVLWGTCLTFLAIFSIKGRELYQAAVQGDFKKETLIQEQYLCSWNAQASGPQRIDLALASVMAGDLEETCLEKEADFALWTQDLRARSWAYLAKSFLFRSNSDQVRQYREKICEEKNSVPCQLSSYLPGKSSASEQNSQPLSKEALNSETGKLLQTSLLLQSGNFEAHQQGLLDFIERGVFGGWTIAQSAKALWMQGSLEKAKGILLGGQLLLEGQVRRESLEWMCFEELELSCNTNLRWSCDRLKKDSLATQEASPEVLSALAIDTVCRKLPLSDLGSVAQKVDQREELLLALSDLHKSSLKASKHLQVTQWKFSEKLRLRFLSQAFLRAENKTEVDALTKLIPGESRELSWLGNKIRKHAEEKAIALGYTMIKDNLRIPASVQKSGGKK